MSKPTPSKWRQNLGPLIGYFCLPLLILIFASFEALQGLVTLTALVLLALAIVARLVVKLPTRSLVLLWTLAILFLVGVSGSFYSPFFFALYLMAIAIGFIYPPSVAVAFTLGLILSFVAYDFGGAGADATHNFMLLLSMISVIPITIALRRSFLLVQQERKGILILEDEKGPSGVTSLDEILSNQVNRIGVTLRQPITYIKQGLAMLSTEDLSAHEEAETLKRMRSATDEMFTLVKDFERGVTNNKFLNQLKEDK